MAESKKANLSLEEDSENEKQKDDSTPERNGDNNEANNSSQTNPEKQSGNRKTIHIGNLSLDTTEEKLKELFNDYGEATNVRIPKDRQNKSKGYGFVELNEENVDAAISALNNSTLDGNTITVDLSHSRPIRERRSFHRRGDYYRDREYDRREGRSSYERDYERDYYDRRDYDRRDRDYDRRDRDYDRSRRGRSYERDYDDERHYRSKHD